MRHCLLILHLLCTIDLSLPLKSPEARRSSDFLVLNPFLLFVHVLPAPFFASISSSPLPRISRFCSPHVTWSCPPSWWHPTRALRQALYRYTCERVCESGRERGRSSGFIPQTCGGGGDPCLGTLLVARAARLGSRGNFYSNSRLLPLSWSLPCHSHFLRSHCPRFGDFLFPFPISLRLLIPRLSLSHPPY